MFSVQEQSIINHALSILSSKFSVGEAIDSAKSAAAYCQLQIAHLPHEVFALMLLNTQHRLLAFDVISAGTIDTASVYPREVVKAVLKHNAAAVILTHNHPSGEASPSTADRTLTEQLQAALALIDVPVLDHIVVGVSESYSFAEHGLL